MDKINEKWVGFLGVALLVLALAFSWESFRVGLYTFKIFPEVRTLTNEEVKLRTDGSLYKLAKFARDNVALDESLYFFNAASYSTHSGRFTVNKLKYYLGPREMQIVDPKDFNIDDALAHDYLISAIPVQMNPLAFELLMNEAGYFAKVFHWADEEAHFFLFKVLSKERKKERVAR